jgi:phosphoglycolate phosphatase
MQKLILFDIDGTLIDSGGAGSRALAAAFEDVYSVSDAFRDISMGGKTDLQIIKEAMYIHGIPSVTDGADMVIQPYVKHLLQEIRNSNKSVKPGVRNILKKVDETDGCWSGLLTGNIREGARIKLDALGLSDHFICGAFGSDDEDRNNLLPIALKSFTDYTGLDLSYGDCTVVGDTPRDVECSKPYGAKAVAVSTGPYSFESLMDTDADLVVASLEDVSESLFAL